MQQTAVEGQKVVMGYENKGPLVEASLHGVIELLPEDAGGVEGVCTAIGSTWRRYVDIWRSICNGEVEGKIINSFSVLLLREAIKVTELHT